MGLADALGEYDRVEVKFSDFYTLVKAASKSELMLNAVNCNVPHRFIREMMIGKTEEPERVNALAEALAKSAKE